MKRNRVANNIPSVDLCLNFALLSWLDCNCEPTASTTTSEVRMKKVDQVCEAYCRSLDRAFAAISTLCLARRYEVIDISCTTTWERAISCQSDRVDGADSNRERINSNVSVRLFLNLFDVSADSQRYRSVCLLMLLCLVLICNVQPSAQPSFQHCRFRILSRLLKSPPRGREAERTSIGRAPASNVTATWMTQFQCRFVFSTSVARSINIKSASCLLMSKGDHRKEF